MPPYGLVDISSHEIAVLLLNHGIFNVSLTAATDHCFRRTSFVKKKERKNSFKVMVCNIWRF